LHRTRVPIETVCDDHAFDDTKTDDGVLAPTQSTGNNFKAGTRGAAAVTSLPIPSPSGLRAVHPNCATNAEAAVTSKRIPVVDDSSDEEDQGSNIVSTSIPSKACGSAVACSARSDIPVDEDSEDSKHECPTEPTEIGNVATADPVPTTTGGWPAPEHPGDAPATPRQKSEELKEAGNSAFKQKDFDLAKKCYDQAIAAYPAADAPYLNRARLQLDQNFASCIQDCTTVLQLHPPRNRKLKAYLRRGNARLKMGDLDGASQDCQVQSCRLLSVL
jgi:hypothetical protein